MLISTTELMKRLKTIEEDIKEIHSNDDESSFVPVEKYCDELITLYEATYDFELNRSKILELYEEERKIKNVLSNFNNNTKVYGYNFNINEGLIRIAELKEEIKVLTNLAKRTKYFYDYRTLSSLNLISYDLDVVKQKLREYQKELNALQVAIDRTNLNSKVEY